MPEVMRFEWRRGPAEMRATLTELRWAALELIGAGIRARAPHPHIAEAVVVTRTAVRIDHRAAWFWETGVARHIPPVGPIIEWAESVGKTAREAYAVARAGVQLPARPYIGPAIRDVMHLIPAKLRELWGH
jgi:hypothetical protein